MKLGQKYKNIIKDVVKNDLIESRGQKFNIVDKNKLFQQILNYCLKQREHNANYFNAWDIIYVLEKNPKYYQEVSNVLGVDEITDKHEYELIDYIDENKNDINSIGYKIYSELVYTKFEMIYEALIMEIIDNKIYRQISTPKNVNQVLEYSEKNGLGCCWAKRFDKAETYYGNCDIDGDNLDIHDYILIGELTDKNINWIATILLRMVNEEEDEIRLKVNVPVKLIKILDVNTNKRYNVNKIMSSGNKLGYKQYNESKNSLNENVNTQYLYHGMWKDQYEYCKKQNKLFGHSVYETFFGYNKKGERIGRKLYGISTSRDVKVSIKFMENIIKEYKNEWNHVDQSAIFSKKIGDDVKYITKDSDLSFVVLVLDYNKIKQNNKIIPHSFLAGTSRQHYGDEQEELIVGDLENLNNYVVNVIEFNNNVNKKTLKSQNLNESFEPKLNDNFWKWFGNSKVVDENGNPLVVYHGSGHNNIESFDASRGTNINAIYFSNKESVASHYSPTGHLKRRTFLNKENVYDELEKINDVNKLLSIWNIYTNAEIKKYSENNWRLEEKDGVERSSPLGRRIDDHTFISGDGKVRDLIKILKREIIEDVYHSEDSTVYPCYLSIKYPLIIDAKSQPYWKIDFNGKKVNTETIADYALNNGYDGVIIYNVYETNYETILCNDYIVFNANQIKSVDNNGNWSLESNNINESASYGGANWQNNMDALGNVPATIGHNLFMTMFPYHFLSLCPKYSYGDDKFFDDYIESKKPIGIPFLIVDFNFDTKTIEVQDHEGRHRVAAISRRNNGNIVDIPVAILYSKNRYPQIPSIEELRKNWTIVSQKGDKEYNVGQFSVYNSFPKSINDKWFNLYESIQLNEGIEEVKKYFPKIQDSDFTKLIALDPTYKGGNELGKYGKWILALYNTFLKDKESYAKWEEQKKLGNNFPEPIRKSQEQIEDFDKIPNLLKDFDVMNTKLRVNINNIKSIADLYKIVNDAKNKGISNNSKINHAIELIKKSVSKGGEVVFKDNNWIVLVPETLESSVVFGNDTNWCTTSPNGERYRYYKNKFGGQYFINLNLQTGELYQFHFESNQFMDKNDNSIEIVPLLNNNISLINFYKKHFGSSLIGKTTCGIMFVDNPTEEMQLAAIKQNGYAIQYIKNPTEKVQLEAVKQNGFLIQYIPNPSEKVQILAVKCFYSAIQYIPNPSEKVQLLAVQKDGYAIQYIDNPTEKVQLLAVQKDGLAIQYIDNPSEEMKLLAVQKDGLAIQYIDNPSEEMKLLAVKQNGYAIQDILNPSKKVQLEAVKQNGNVIRYIPNPSEKVQLEAVKQNGYLIRYIDNPTEQVQLEAVKHRTGSAYDDYFSTPYGPLGFINNPSEQVQWEAIKYNGLAIGVIDNPSEEMQLLAVKQNGGAFETIDNPTDKVKTFYRKLYGKPINVSLQLNEHGINDIKIEIDEILSSNYHQIYFDTYNHIVKIVCNNNKEATYSFDFSKNIDKFNKLCRSLLARFEKNFDFRLTIEQVYNKIEEYNGDSISKNAVHTILKGYYKDFIKSII